MSISKQTNTSLRSLGFAGFLFPLCLVLYEFTVYIGNDMTQPAMPMIVDQFSADKKWIPTSMTAYLAGGMFLQWLLGPLSDRKGRRPVMLAGVFSFIVACLAILWVSSIEQFMLMRFLQGFGLCFIGAVGYAAIQESYNESTAIKLTALMANVSLIAPMLGPLAGAALIKVTSWHTMFVIFAVLSAIAFLGLYKSMPETAPLKGQRLEFKPILQDYAQVFANRQFLKGACAVGFAGLPLLAWIAQTPVIFITDRKMDTYGYSLLQIPVFMALLIGNIILSKITDKLPITKPIKIGAFPLMLGLCIAGVGSYFQPGNHWWMVTGISLYAFGLGLANAGLYRLSLFSSDVSKGTVSAILGMITVAIFTLGIELAKYCYESFGLRGFNVIALLSGIIWLVLVYSFLTKHKTVNID